MKSKLWIYEFIMKNMKNKIKSLPRKSRAVIALCEIPLSRLERKIATSKAHSKYVVEYFFYWWIFAKFRPEKYDFNLYKGFFMKEITQVHPKKKV